MKGATMLPSRAEQWHLAILDLLKEVNLCQPDQLPQLVTAVTEQLATDVRIFLIDYEQRVLREFAPRSRPGEDLPLLGTLAGLAFQRGQVQLESGEMAVQWIPLVDSTERLGVLRIAPMDAHPGPLNGEDPEVQFANLLGHLITTKLPYGDRLHQVRSSQPMTVASVLLRQLLPPSTFTSDRLVISASLQPAYAVGGDAFDYAVDGDLCHISIFDAVGHGLEAGLTVAVAVAATRAGRRNEEQLEGLAESADAYLNDQFHDSRFVTAVLARLDLASGVLRYVNAGHPPPIVLRRNGGALELEAGKRLPLALSGQPWSSGSHRLQPGDRLLLYTDGSIHTRNGDGEFFGVERLIDLARRHVAAQETAPEIVRKINEEVVGFHGGPPEDDSTVALLEWSSTAAYRTLP